MTAPSEFTRFTQEQIRKANELSKLALIGKAAEALATAAAGNNVPIEDLVPMVVSLAKKKS